MKKTIKVVTTLVDNIFVTRKAIVNHNAETLRVLNNYLASITKNGGKLWKFGTSFVRSSLRNSVYHNTGEK